MQVSPPEAPLFEAYCVADLRRSAACADPGFRPSTPHMCREYTGYAFRRAIVLEHRGVM